METIEISLPQMLDARERRAHHQLELLHQYQKPLLCFTMNIAGPIKNSDLILRGFLTGVEDMKLQLKKKHAKILFEEILQDPTGNEGYFVIDFDAFALKSLTCELEDFDELGRLYDMDVLLPPETNHPFGRKIDRQEIGLSGRHCLICERPAKECSSRRTHSIEELQTYTTDILSRILREREAKRISNFALRSLLYEVSVSPKPGLVDRFDCGSHKDMDFFTFLNSSSVLWPYFYQCVCLGQTHPKSHPLNELLPKLRIHGKQAENEMLLATDGINTHKGAIFTLGILCAAIGTQFPVDTSTVDSILESCAQITKNLIKDDYRDLTMQKATTVGQRLYLEYGITGVRGEIANGLPVVKTFGLPTLKKALDDGDGFDLAGAKTLLSILTHMVDTNMIARSDVKTAKEYQNDIRLQHKINIDLLHQLNQEFIEKNLSPGGSADLLAVCFLLYFLMH